MKEWLSKIQFVLSGNIHGGALVGSYPFDNTPNSIFSSVLSSPSLTPDDDTFKHLAATYSLNHGRMYLGDPCKVRSRIVEIFPEESNTQPFFQTFAYHWMSNHHLLTLLLISVHDTYLRNIPIMILGRSSPIPQWYNQWCSMVPIDRRNARLQLHLARLHGGHS